MSKVYGCPVCGYDRLDGPPVDFLICPCCGVEFGYQDSRVSHRVLRAEWIDAGCKWFSHVTPAPEGWSPGYQIDCLIPEAK